MTVFKIKFDTTMYVASLSQLILFLRRDIPVEFELAVYDDDFKQWPLRLESNIDWN